MNKTSAIIWTVLLLSTVGFAQEEFDLSKNFYSFSGETLGGSRPDFDKFQDPVLNRIGNACLHGADWRQLRRLNIPDLEARAKDLVDANDIVFRNGKCFLGVPSITGKERAELEKLVERKAEQIAPSVAVMLEEIRKAVPGKEEMAFHLLWSRAMDDMWYPAWQFEARPGKGPPTVRWVIYPQHPFSFGTASYDGALGGGSNAKTWSHDSICNDYRISDYQKEILLGAWGKEVKSDIAPLEKDGLFNRDRRFVGFAYHSGDDLDKLLRQLRVRYATLVAHAYDYEKLAESWNVPVDELWVAIQHETAYAVFERLAKRHKLTIPDPLKGIGDTHACRTVVSIRLLNPPE